MSKLIDLTGQKFGTWTIINLHHCNRYAYWNGICDCGCSKIIKGTYIIRLYKIGKTLRCGCSADNNKAIKYTSKTNKANNANKCTKNHRLRPDNKCGQQGIYFNKKTKKWAVSIYVCGKRINLGIYTDINIAKKVRTKAELEYRR